MMNPTASEIKRMSVDERTRHYEDEKRELFYLAHKMSVEEYNQAREYLSRKWRI